MLAMPLARYRRALTHLSDDELTALARRLTLQEIRRRWELGSHGLARHCAPLALELLARRRAALTAEREQRASSATRQLRLVETDSGVFALASQVREEQAA
jgi:hypothetical protein